MRVTGQANWIPVIASGVQKGDDHGVIHTDADGAGGANSSRGSYQNPPIILH
jgi:hypothetical protein